jgi:hypothetical protein
MSAPITPQTALIYIMVTVAAADRDMTDRELMAIGAVVRSLPIFRDYNQNLLPAMAEDCAQLLQQEDGLDTVFSLARNALSPRLRETGYAVAVEVAAADLKTGQEVIRLLQILQEKLEIDRLVAAAIERAARARHSVL